MRVRGSLTRREIVGWIGRLGVWEFWGPGRQGVLYHGIRSCILLKVGVLGYECNL